MISMYSIWVQVNKKTMKLNVNQLPAIIFPSPWTVSASKRPGLAEVEEKKLKKVIQAKIETKTFIVTK